MVYDVDWRVIDDPAAAAFGLGANFDSMVS